MIDKFIANVKRGGLARTNRYVVNIAKPIVMEDYIYRKIMLFCDQIQLPGVNYSTTQNRSFGEFREIPYEKLFGDVNLSFYVDKDMHVKDFFDRWINRIQDGETRLFNYYNQYTTTTSIDVQDTMNDSTYRVTLYECYPKTLSPIQMDYASKDIMKLQVTLQYKYWDSFLIESQRKADVDTTPKVDYGTYFNDWGAVQSQVLNLVEETSKTTGPSVEKLWEWYDDGEIYEEDW